MASATTSYFQGGDYVELLSAQGKAPASTWKLQGKIIKSFDKTIKGNAFQMDGSSETKMQLPKTTPSSSSSLGLTQRFLVFQLLVPHTRSFSVEIGFSDFQKIRRRLVIASAFRETTMTTLHVQIPIGSGVPRDQWMNFVFDLQALTERFFPASSYRSMESICISGSCRLKRIFTMKDAPLCHAVQDQLEAQLRQVKHLRHQSKDPVSAPTAVAGFAEMKEIPKQFVFSASPSCLSIPTEYFLVSTEREDNPIAASKGASKPPTMKPAGKTVEVSKPRSAAICGGRGRPLATGRVATESSPSGETRARSAPSSRVPNSQQPEPTVRLGQGIKAKASPRGSSGTEDSPPRLSSRPDSAWRDAPKYSHPIPSLPHHISSEEISDNDEEEEAGGITVNVDAVIATERMAKLRHSPTNQGRGFERNDTDGLAVSQRRKHRQNVISEIQSKLDQLTKEAEDEDERDREMFLRHTSIASELQSPVPGHDARKELPSVEEASSQLSKTGSIKNATVDACIDHWHDKEMLRSPEPMVLRRVHAAKKPELAFTSSIFTFDHGGSPSMSLPSRGSTEKKPAPHTKKLFDWESLLEDSVGSFSQSQNTGTKSSSALDKQQTPVVAQNTRASGSRHFGGTGDLKSDEEQHNRLRNGEEPMDQRTDRADDVSLMRRLDVTRLGRHQVETQQSSEASEEALASESAWELRHSERLPPQKQQTSHGEDVDDEVKSSFDFSMSPTRPRKDTASGDDQTGRALQDHSSPRDGPDAAVSLDFTEYVRDLGPSYRVSTPRAGAEDEKTWDPRSDDQDDDDSFDFDDLVVRDRDYSPPFKKIPHPEQDVHVKHSEPDKRKSNEIKSSNKNRVEANRSVTSLERTQTAGAKGPTRESRSHEVPTVSRTTSARKQTAKLRDASESPPRPSSSRALSSSDRRLASLLESTDWSQLPLSSTVVSQEREPHVKVTKPTTDPAETKTPRNRSPKSNRAASSSLELIWDPILRCYYDPVGKKYYTLAR